MRYISHEDSLLEIHLKRMVTTREKYTVQLKKDDQKLVSFDMTLGSNDKWKVMQPVPVWVSRLVPELIKAIQNHRRFFN
jgi:hypothetical protein